MIRGIRFTGPGFVCVPVCELRSILPFTAFPARFAMKKICPSTAVAVVVCLFFAALLATGCNRPRKIVKNIDPGGWSGTTYENSFFGLAITVPDGWHIAGKEEIQAAEQAGQNADFVNKNEANKISNVAKDTTTNLFMALRYTPAEAERRGAFNPNLFLGAENLSASRIPINQAKYAEVFRQQLRRAAPGIVFKPASNKIIDSVEFASQQIEITTHGMRVHMEYLISVEDNIALVFNLTWMEDSEKKQLDSIMATLKWNWDDEDAP